MVLERGREPAWGQGRHNALQRESSEGLSPAEQHCQSCLHFSTQPEGPRSKDRLEPLFTSVNPFVFQAHKRQF